MYAMRVLHISTLLGKALENTQSAFIKILFIQIMVGKVNFFLLEMRSVPAIVLNALNCFQQFPAFASQQHNYPMN